MHEIAGSLVEWSDSNRLLDLFVALPNRAYVHGADTAVDHLARPLDDTPTYRIGRSGHFPMIDNPDDLYAALAGIVAGHRGGTERYHGRRAEGRTAVHG